MSSPFAVCRRLYEDLRVDAKLRAHVRWDEIEKVYHLLDDSDYAMEVIYDFLNRQDDIEEACIDWDYERLIQTQFLDKSAAEWFCFHANAMLSTVLTDQQKKDAIVNREPDDGTISKQDVKDAIQDALDENDSFDITDLYIVSGSIVAIGGISILALIVYKNPGVILTTTKLLSAMVKELSLA